MGALATRGPVGGLEESASRRRPVMLVTLDAPIVPEARTLAIDAAVESGQPLIVVNVAEVVPSHSILFGYGYVGSEQLEQQLRETAALALSLAVQVERLRVCSPHPVDALLELVAEREPGMLVFGPEPSRMRRRTYERAARRVCERAGCLVWTAIGLAPE